MASDDPDIEQLFAPIAPTTAFVVILREAQDVLANVHEPADAELWGSDMIGALSRSGGSEAEIMPELVRSLVPAAEEAATTESLALLRIFAALGSPELARTATDAAERIKALGVSDPAWATGLGAPEVGDCWHYGDVSGQQESVTTTFAYGDKAHALSVLIDHNHGGRIRDAWVSDAAGLLDKTWLTAENDPMVIFENLDPAGARDRLRHAVTAGECPRNPDQIDGVIAHRAFLHARLKLLTARTA
jgi:hypothetical protein